MLQTLMEKEDMKTLKGERIRLFTGNANPRLAQAIANYLGVPLGDALVGRFTNGEVRVKIEENVRGNDVFVIQPTCPPVNDNLMELLIMIDALSRSSARTITAVIPYYGYAKQEKKTAGREPISAKLVANLITVAQASRVITLDLHAAAIQGFFDIPVDNLYAQPIIMEYFRKHKALESGKTVVVSPDAGGVARARAMAERLSASLAIIFKKRPKPDVAEVMEIVGDVKGKTAIIVDDMISTGGTLVQAACRLKEEGANKVYAAVTHAILADQAVDLLNRSPIEEIICTDTIPIPASATDGKFVVVSVAELLGEAIRRNHFNLSVSKLFS
ncbi:MAG: ribose-phosphate diphosphokinase [Candidatus Xenobia bacterium]